MKKNLILLLLSTISLAAFSQKETPAPKGFQLIAADNAVVSNDSNITTFTGHVEVKGDTFHFSKAEKIVYNKKEGTLLIFNCADIHADSVTVITGADGKKYLRYKLK